MSQELCYITLSGSIFRSLRSFVLPHLITGDVLCTTARIRSRKQNPGSGVDVGKKSGVQDCRRFEGHLSCFSGFERIGRQADDSADQAATETPEVSVSVATSRSTESTSVPSDSDPSTNSSSGTSIITPPPTNAASASDAGTASTAPPNSSAAEQSVSVRSETTSPVQSSITASTSVSSAGDSTSVTESAPPADPPITPSPPLTFQPFPTSRFPTTFPQTSTPSPTSSYPSSINLPSTASVSSTLLSSLMDGGGSSAPALPPETTTGAGPVGPPSTPPVSTVSNPATTTSPPNLPPTVSNALPTPPSSTADPIENSTPILPLPSSSSSLMTTSLDPFPTIQSWSYSSHWTDAASFSTSTLGTSTVLGISSTSTFTTVFTTTLSNGRTSTITTVVETGTLSTDTPKPSGLARSTGAMIGVALSATFAFILIVLLLFFACKRYKSRRSNHGSMENILAMAREVAWRPPLDGDDDDSYLAGYPQPQLRPPGSQGHSREDVHDGQGGTYVGRHLSGASGGVEVRNAGPVPTMNPIFGGQPYMPGFEQGPQNTYGRPEPTPIPRYGSIEPPETTQVWWGINDPQVVYGENRQPIDDVHAGFGPGRSAASLTMVGGSSSGGHGGAYGGASSSGEHNLRTSTPMKRNSLSAPRPVPARESPRHSSSTPPSAFPTTSDPNFDYERQAQDQSDKMSVKGFFSRLRSGRRVSTQSVMTIRAPPQVRDESFPPASNLYSPSLLNPPTTIPPPNPILHFSGGVANGYGSLSIRPPQDANQDQGFSAHPPSGLWTPVTLPPAPSPVPTDNSSMVEGLLHPRLGMKLSLSHQASTASLRDNEDYTRPINGLVNNHLRSTTTFETQDTIGPEHIGQSTGR